MSPSNDSTPKVAQFDGTKYPLWAFKMKMYLISKGLWEAVNATSGVSEAKEQQAHAAIVLNLSDTQLTHVITTSSACEAWGALARVHRAQDMASRLWLKEKFATFKFTASDMSAHVMELERLVLEMNGASCGPSEEDTCATVLRILPAQYEGLVQAFRMSVTQFSFKDLVSKLIAEEVRKKDSTRIEDETALHVGKRQEKKSFNKRSGGPRKTGKKKAANGERQEDHSNVAFTVTQGNTSDCWIMDCGATAHMCKDKDAFIDYTASPTARNVKSAKNSASLKALGQGTVILRVWNGTLWINDRLENTLHVQDINKNLFSLTAATARGMTVEITSDGCTVLKSGRIVASGKRCGMLINLNVEESPQCHMVEGEAELWHRRLGHVSYSTVNKLIQDGCIKGKCLDSNVVCDICATAKQVRKTFHSTKADAEARESHRMDSVICSDVLGPITPASRSTYRYVATFMMMNSRFAMVFPLRKKSEVTKALKRCCHDIKIECGLDVKVLRSDNGGEYRNDEMTRFCHQKMIKQEFTVPYNPEQNGMAERLNRTLVEMTRCMLSESKMDKTFWCEAMLTAVDILNVLPRASSPNLSPFEMVFKRKPRMDIMRVFGSLCYAHIPKQNRNKLDPSGLRCMLLGYAKQHKAYRLLNTATGKVFVSRSVTFVETAEEQTRYEDTPSVIDVVGDGDDLQDPRDHAISDEGTCTPVPGSPIMTPNRRDGEQEWNVRPARKKQAIKRYEQEFPNLRRGTFNLDDYDASYATQYCLSAEEDGESASTYSQVLESKYKDDWIRAMKSEIQALTQHDTWTLQDLPSDKRSIGCKWVFRIKRKPNGEIVKFKARLVAKGFSQRPGVDYFETFSPVARKESINVAIALAAEQDLIMENVDVDTAFLYGEFKEEIYMDQPDGFVDKQHRDKKCLLNKALYGTKQAAREWNHRLNAHLESQGFTRTSADLCVYVRQSDTQFSLVIIHVDDLMLFARTQEHIDDIKRALKTEFSIKELGELKYCLGIELTRDRKSKSIRMNQRAYIKRLTEKFGVDQCKDVHTPSNESEKLTKLGDDDEFVPKWPYRELVGALMYVATCTRPDIMHAVGEVAKYCERHGKSHWIAAKRVLKYLKTTADYSIVFHGTDKGELLGFADASWASDLDSRRSTTGYVFFLHGNVVSWKWKRQPTVATSSTEAEYIALYAAAQEAVWLRLLLSDIGVEVGAATTIYEDNQGCIALAKNPVYHARTKHIDIKYHFLRDKVEEGVIELEYMPTEAMIADGLTKALGLTKHAVFLQGLHLEV
uniref:Integrase catalytic domain-containing protein n=1 Tax=Peronospora matthiolae TaxID=2874970 RepID=A0AAV1V3K5_9STRA